jgi:hypothetical protein
MCKGGGVHPFAQRLGTLLCGRVHFALGVLLRGRVVVTADFALGALLRRRVVVTADFALGALLCRSACFTSFCSLHPKMSVRVGEMA